MILINLIISKDLEINENIHLIYYKEEKHKIIDINQKALI